MVCSIFSQQREKILHTIMRMRILVWRSPQTIRFVNACTEKHPCGVPMRSKIVVTKIIDLIRCSCYENCPRSSSHSSIGVSPIRDPKLIALFYSIVRHYYRLNCICRPRWLWRRMLEMRCSQDSSYIFITYYLCCAMEPPYRIKILYCSHTAVRRPTPTNPKRSSSELVTFGNPDVHGASNKHMRAASNRMHRFGFVWLELRKISNASETNESVDGTAILHCE